MKLGKMLESHKEHCKIHSYIKKEPAQHIQNCMRSPKSWENRNEIKYRADILKQRKEHIKRKIREFNS